MRRTAVRGKIARTHWARLTCVEQTLLVRTRPSLIVAIAREALALPDRLAHGLVLRDLDAWLRVQFLGIAGRTGIADTLTEEPTIHDLATRAGVVDVDLLATFLRSA